MPSPVHLAALLGSQFDPFRLPNTAAAYDYDDLSSLIYNVSNQLLITGDKSGNSATNCLVLNGVSGNYASFAALTAFRINNFSITAKINVASLAASSRVVGSAANGFALIIGTDGKLTGSKQGVVNVSAPSTGALSVFSEATVAYTRTGTTGTYYINGVASGTATDNLDYSVGVTNVGATLAGTFGVLGGVVQYARVYSVALDAVGVLADSAGTVQANCVFNARFDLAAKLATSFTESSSNAATVTINQSGDAGARICGERDIYQNTLGKCSVLSNVGGYWGASQDGSNDFSKTGRFSLAQPLSIYWVGTITTWTANDIILDGGANDTMEIFQDTTTPRLSAYAGGTVGPLTQFAVGQKHVFGLVLNGANSFAAVDLNPIVSGNAGTATPNGITLGSQATGSANSNIATNKLLIRSVADDAALFTRIMAKLVGRNAVS